MLGMYGGDPITRLIDADGGRRSVFRASIDMVMVALETAHDWASCSAGICPIGTGE
jgi:hypothetical protein